MVGVPGRSRACLPCKKRRVACDLQQPECTRCVKARRNCEYAQGRIFVLNDEGTHRTMYKKSDGVLASPKNDKSKSSPPNRAPTSPSISRDDSALLIAKEEINQPVLLCKRPPDALLAQQALLSHALDGNLAHTALGFLSCSTSASLATPCLRASFLACYSGWIGRRDHDPRLVDAGRELYVEALRSTNFALAVDQTAGKVETLAACSALGIYEALECPGGSKVAYLWHRDACNRLVRMRGPEAHQTGPAHRLFINFRFFGILHAFDSNTDTFLSDPSWLTIPFSVNAKNNFDLLLDIFALGPETSRIGRSLSTLPPDEVFPVAVDLLEKLAVIKAKLATFYEDLMSRSEDLLWWERISPTREDVVQWSGEGDFVFPPAIWFRDIETAGLLTLYWAILAMVWSGLHDLHNLFAEHDFIPLFLSIMCANGDDPSEYDPERMRLLCIDRARKVLQSVAYTTTDEALRLGPPRGMAQLAIVVDILKRRKGCEAEYRWARKVRKRVGARWLKLFDAPDW